MTNKHSILPDEKVISKIFVLRDKRIMLDRDLAELYGVKSIRRREQVKKTSRGSLQILCSNYLNMR